MNGGLIVHSARISVLRRSLTASSVPWGSFVAASILFTAATGCSAQPAEQASDTPTPALSDRDARVESPEALEEMRHYLSDRIRPEHVRQSFQQPSGGWVDCVLANQQPGMRDTGEELLTPPPSPFSDETTSNLPSPAQHDEAFLAEDRAGRESGQACPDGTIPVRRVSIEVLVRFRTLSHFLRKQSARAAGEAPQYAPTANGPTGLHQYAHAANWNVTNLGAASWLNVWTPTVAAAGEFSLSQLWVTRGAGAGLQTLEAGWQVAPSYFGDARPHLFIYSTSDGYTTNAGGCYNLDCGRFVQTNTSIVVGGALSASRSGGAQYDIRLMYAYDAGTKAWWLWIRRGATTTTDTAIGYYRASLFNSGGLGGASPHASTVDFGGEIIDDRSMHASHTGTDMGAGAYPATGYGYSAYHRNAVYRGADGAWRNAALTRDVDDSYCYDLAGPALDSGGWNTYFYFGGPGNNVNCR
jgi:hypothetical protein